MLATNARESIRFIDRVVSCEDLGVSSTLILETPEEVGPNWRKCMTYKIRSPKVHEFPVNSKNVLSKPASIKYENEDGSDDEDVDAGNDHNQSIERLRKQKAEIPARLKYLIRPCIKKTHVDEEEWKLITEDLPTKIWCESFGIKCFNLSEAESLLFHTKNKLQAERDPSYALKDLSIQDSNHKSQNSKRKRSRSSKNKNHNNNNGNNQDHGNGPDGTFIESFDSISYAPRGSGELWVP